jgi:hypothetical protein
VRRADNLTTFMCRLSRNLEASTSWNPKGLSRSVMGLLYLYLYLFSVFCRVFLRSLFISFRCCPLYSFLGVFPKQLRIGTISLVMSVRPSVRMEERKSYRTDFREILFGSFSKIYRQILILMKTGHKEHFT